MKKYKITVNGNEYEVDVEELKDGVDAGRPVPIAYDTPTTLSAAAPTAIPVAKPAQAKTAAATPRRREARRGGAPPVLCF